MHRIIIFLALVILGFQLNAQSTLNNWFVDLEEAQSYAKDHSGQILMVFSGSDWCKPCIQFKKDILTADAFKQYADANLTILYLDFPARKKNKLSKAQTKHNEALAEKYNRQGAFPKIVLLDSEDVILAQPEFRGQSPDDFIAELKNSNK